MAVVESVSVLRAPGRSPRRCLDNDSDNNEGDDMRKTKNRRNAKLEDSDDDTYSSSSSTAPSAASDATVTEVVDDDSVLDDYIDALYEKRASIRESALKALLSAFSSKVMTELIDNKYATLTHQFLASLKRGSSAETVLASRGLAMLCVTAGAGDVSEYVLKESSSQLIRIAKLGSTPAARVSAIESLAILTFVGGVEVASTESAMETFWQIASHKGNAHAEQALGMNKPTPPVKAAAVSAWTLLLTTLSGDRAGKEIASNVSVFSSLLEVQDSALRKAAGETIAMLYEIGGDDELDTIAETENQVVEQIKALVVDASRQGCSKREKSEQRSIFKEMLATIEDGACPETSIKFKHGDVLRIDTWIGTIRLNAFRRLLAEAFQKHMQDNVLMHEIFDFVPRCGKERMISAKYKKQDMSLAGKIRTQQMNRYRSIAEAGRQQIDSD